MATDSISQLNALMDAVRPLGGKTAGDPISAAQWNTIIRTLLGLLSHETDQETAERAQLEERFARREHQHTGEVSLSWLDPELQELLGGRTASATRSQFAEMEKKVAALGAEVKRLTAANEELHRRLDDFIAADVDRMNTVRNLGDRVTKFGDVKERVEKLDVELKGLTPRIDKAVALGANLTDVDGTPINLVAVRERIAGLEKLRDTNLVGSDGAPVRIRDLEQQIRELRITSGLGTGLEPRLATLSAGIEDRLGTLVKSQIGTVSTTLAGQQKELIETAVNPKISAAVEGVTALIGTRIKESEGRLNTAIPATVLATVRGEAEERNKAVDQKFAAVPVQVDAAITAARPGIESNVRSSMTATLTVDMNRTVAAAEKRITDRVALTESTLNGLRDTLPLSITIATKAAAVDLRDGLVAEIDTRVKQSEQTIKGLIPAGVNDAVGTRLANLDQRIVNTVDARVGDLDGRVRAAVEVAARIIPTTIDSEVTKRIATLDIGTQINRATTEVEGRLTNTINTRLSAERQATAALIDTTTLRLRGEITSAVATEGIAVRGLITNIKREQDTKFTPVDKKVLVVDKINLNP
ncbi:MAG TPA: hypothetical protein VJ276_15585 [Thermoanaerobaculia bacterium]|nr:hypothetical protein [Thermoanaerobaculia bacterium]